MRSYLIFIVLFCLASVAFAAGPPGPPGGGMGPGCWPPPCVPIDGGISFLIGAGLIYGSSKVVKRKK